MKEVWYKESQLYNETCPNKHFRFHRGLDLIIVGFTTICAISAYHHQSCEFESHSGEMFSYNIR
jgi:hypothetical protein